MEKFDKLLAKKMKDKKSSMGDTERDAKMSVLEHVKDLAQNMMKDKLGGLKKVTVASDSPEGIQEGLMKAKAMLGSHGEDSSDDSDEGEDHAMPHPDTHSEASSSSEPSESPADEAAEMESDEHDSDDLSEDEVDQKLQELMALKERMQAKKRM